MDIKELLKKRLEKSKCYNRDDYKELGLYGEGYCEFDDDYDDDYDEDDW